MSSNAMNFGPAWMRGDASRPSRGGDEGRDSPNVVHAHSNGAQPIDSSLHPPGINGISSNNPYGRTSSFSYSSILASTPAAASSTQPPNTGDGGNGVMSANHDKPFKYSRDEMLNIWKNNAAKYKSTGIPLEFEKHEAFTSEEPLDPALLTEMTLGEKEAFAGPMNSDKPDAAMQARLDRAAARQFPPRNERFQQGTPGGSGRSGAIPRNRTSSRGESGTAPYTTNRPTPLRSSKSRDYFTGAFGGSSTFTAENSPPDKDLWGSATKKGSFDENGKFVVADDENNRPLEEEKLENTTNDTGDLIDDRVKETTSDSPTQLSDGFSLPAAGGRATSRFTSFGLPEAEDDPPSANNEPPALQFADDHDDDVNDILSMVAGPRPISPPHQMDRLTSRFASQSLGPDPSQYDAFGGIGSFDTDPIRRDPTATSQFFPGPPQPQPPQQPPKPLTKAGLFEHPVVPQQPALPPPPPQTTRVMIMADKLKWVYKDPQGNVQGPFTGLEMHEWYRGGYFHATLEVKREDDVHFDQLQTLVKKIGNQREPFLVPLPSKTQTQLIPPRSTTTLSGWNTTLFGEGIEDPKVWNIAPPTIQAAALSGTTLTADQQNALERRKQEEQYLLVRQREMTVQQHPPIHPLHHPAPQHPFNPSPPYPGFGPLHTLPLGVTHHVHTPGPVQVQTLPALDALRTGGGSVPPVQPPPPQTQSPQEHQYQSTQQNRGFMSPWGAGPLGPLSPGMVEMHQPPLQESFGFTEETVLSQEEKPASPVNPVPAAVPEIEVEIQNSSVSPDFAKPEITSPITLESDAPETELELLSEPVASELPTEEETSIDTSADQVPPVATIASPARVAPWATSQKKDDSKKSLTLKQIQELETKRAAEQARRIAAERQAQLQHTPVVVSPQSPQQGLPQGSTWGSVAAKGWAARTVATPAASPGKKTMAQIQKEEEEERAKLAKAKESLTGATPVRGYAGAAAAASKPAVPTAWTMVGPGGRPQPGRPIHSGGVNPNVPTQSTSSVQSSSPGRPPPIRTTSQDQKPVKVSPQPPPSANGVEEFQKWCRSQLKLLSGVNYDEIYQMMLSLPPNESTTQEIISDTIYAHSSTLDGRHFAEEFLKRRKALGAALDVPPSAASVTSSGSGSGSGWNEVLKKEKTKDASGEWNSAFKVVAGKKGRRRG